MKKIRMQSRKEMVKVPEQGSSKLSMRLLTFGFVSTLLGVLTIGTASEECHPLQLKSKVSPFSPNSDSDTVWEYAYIGRIPSTEIVVHLKVDDGSLEASCLDTTAGFVVELELIAREEPPRSLFSQRTTSWNNVVSMKSQSFGNFTAKMLLWMNSEVVGTTHTNFQIGIGDPMFGVNSCVTPPGMGEHQMAQSYYPRLDIPESMCAEFTMNYQIPVSRWYFDDKSDPDTSYQVRTREYIDNLVEQAKARVMWYYEEMDLWLWEALEAYPIKGKRVLIVGSNIPWYEAICIEAGAEECWTLEYNQLRWDHPKIHTIQVADFDAAVESGRLQLDFDQVWSFSALEHDGLGRYGDPISPSADFYSMDKFQSYVKEDGVVIFSVPVGKDLLVFNAGRIYGRLRLERMFRNWDIQASYGFKYADFDRDINLASPQGHQPIWVLKPDHQRWAWT